MGNFKIEIVNTIESSKIIILNLDTLKSQSFTIDYEDADSSKMVEMFNALGFNDVTYQICY